MLQFPSLALPRPLEDFLKEVRQAPGQALKMPILLKLGGGLGGAVQAIQVVATWARLDGAEGVLALPPAFAEQENTRDRFASTLPGMSALYFARKLVCSGFHFSRFNALEKVAPRISAMQAGDYQNTLRGQGVALCCFVGAKSEFLSPLYAKQDYGSVRDSNDFRTLLPRILQHLSLRQTRLDEGQLDYLSGLIYQLFLNADEHGSFDEDGNAYELGVRGVAVRVSTFPDIKALLDYAGQDAPLKSYLLKRAFEKTLEEKELEPGAKLPFGPLQILEISVFDTGPGMGLKWLSQRTNCKNYGDISLDEELEAVKTCFQKHATTKASDFKGQGLLMALRAMKKLDAFMTLRTGRMSLFQDFSRGDTSEFSPKPRFGAGSHVAEIAGTGYTICFKVK